MSDRTSNQGTASTPGIPGGGLADLLSDLVRDLTGIVRGEGRLMRAELADAARNAAAGAEMMAAGAILLLLAALVLVQALVIALAEVIGPGWSATVVGAVLGILGAVLVYRGRHNLSAARLIPERTMEQTSRDIRLAKEQL